MRILGYFCLSNELHVIFNPFLSAVHAKKSPIFMIFKTVTGFGGDNVVECIDIQIIANTSILKLNHMKT